MKFNKDDFVIFNYNKIQANLAGIGPLINGHKYRITDISKNSLSTIYQLIIDHEIPDCYAKYWWVYAPCLRLANKHRSFISYNPVNLPKE